MRPRLADFGLGRRVCCRLERGHKWLHAGSQAPRSTASFCQLPPGFPLVSSRRRRPRARLVLQRESWNAEKGDRPELNLKPGAQPSPAELCESRQEGLNLGQLQHQERKGKGLHLSTADRLDIIRQHRHNGSGVVTVTRKTDTHRNVLLCLRANKGPNPSFGKWATASSQERGHSFPVTFGVSPVR